MQIQKHIIKPLNLLKRLVDMWLELGNSNMKKLDKMKNVIDYAHSNLRSDFMDVFWVLHQNFAL